MKTPSRRISLLSCVASLAFLASPVYAGFTQVSSVSGNDSIAWSTLGGDLTALTPPVHSTTADGFAYTVQGPAALAIFQGSTYNADFLPNDFVISAFDLNSFTALSDPIEIDLPFLALALGMRVQVNPFGPFSATMQAFDAGSNLLGSVTVNGANNGNGDGSAIFLGGMTTSAPIAKVLISSPSEGLALDTVTLLDVAPEPGCLFLAAPALAMLILRKRARR